MEALVRLGPSVTTLVIILVADGRESFTTLVTFVGLDTGVRSFVNVEIALLRKCFVALVASVDSWRW